MNKQPVFIHSLFRAGSTYLFNVFRRSSEGYFCYQEPLHELVVLAQNEPEILLNNLGNEAMLQYRHPNIGLPYFQELYEVWPVWKGAISEEAIFNSYFAPAGKDIGILYWQTLIKAAKGRPVFQECRTSSRIAAIKNRLDGYHIYLWRNPWDQWWSYKVTEYFDLANQMIINAPNAPLAVQILRNELRIGVYSSTDIAGAFAYYSANPLNAEQSYMIFYMLWCLGLQEGSRYANQMLNIDRLSDDLDYRHQMQKQLCDAEILGIDFSDCHVPQGFYIDSDKKFFLQLETRVHGWLLAGGWSQVDLAEILNLRKQFEPASWEMLNTNFNQPDFVEHLSRARALAIRLENSIADTKAQARQAKAQARQAEAQARQAEAIIGAMESCISWRLTVPFRKVGQLVYSFVTWRKK